jgi:hypothetical protein
LFHTALNGTALLFKESRDMMCGEMELMEMELAFICFKTFPVRTEESHENVRIARWQPGLEPGTS